MTTEDVLNRLEDMQTEHELLMDDVRLKGEGISDDTHAALDILWHDIMNAISDITEGQNAPVDPEPTLSAAERNK